MLNLVNSEKEIGFSDNYGDIPFGLMYHGLTSPDEAYSKETQGCITMRMWCPVMHNGVIKFIKTRRLCDDKS